MKAIRYTANGKYLRNTLFSTTNSDFIGAYHGVETDAIFNAELAAEEEATTIASHKQDFGAAFGIPADEIECEVIAWDGDPDHLPKEDESNALERIPEEQRPGYVAPVPVPPTPLEIIANAILADAGTSTALKDAARAAIVAGGEVVSDRVIPMVPRKE